MKITRSTGIGGPRAANGRLYAGDAPGLCMTPDCNSLGPPGAMFEEG